VIVFNLVNICNLKRNLIGSGGLVKIGLVKIGLVKIGLVKIGLVKMGRERYLTGDNLKIVRAEFSTLS